jgi:hypothetical protein
MGNFTDYTLYNPITSVVTCQSPSSLRSLLFLINRTGEKKNPPLALTKTSQKLDVNFGSIEQLQTITLKFN